MVALLLFPTFLSALLMSAHMMRSHGLYAALGFLSICLLFFSKKRWVVQALSGLLILAACEWLRTGWFIAERRWELDQPWMRMAIILTFVALFNLLAFFLIRHPRVLDRFHSDIPSARISSSAFLATYVLLLIIHNSAGGEMLLAERFFPGSYWLETFALSTWAAFVAEWLFDVKKVPRTRVLVWSLFSGVFFLQLFLGLLGFESFLMSGELHLPVPAMIVAGPVFRTEGFFMVLIFLSTLILIGPAWCSYLCYVGAWDNALAMKKKRVGPPSGLSKRLFKIDTRWVILLLVALTAFLLRTAGISSVVAASLGGLFGMIGVGIMVTASRRSGRMVHCTEYCPIGFLAVKIGKVNPFRLKIGNDCTSCSACIPTCRYGALTPSDLSSGKPGPTCTLCGDCLSSCRQGFISYRFFKLSPEKARQVFIATAAALHALFLGVARI